MPSAEIITIGSEILLGEIVDTNSQYIARTLRDIGVDLYRKTTVGDNVERIVTVIRQTMERCEIIITTGGLGPTVDDPTREAISIATGLDLEFRSELWDQIKSRFQRYGRTPTENNRQQAYIPQGAIPIENPVGTAPSFIVEIDDKAIISLPGVPREMEYLVRYAVIPYLKEHYRLKGFIKTRILHTVGVGESQIDQLIADLEKMSNPTVGLSAHSGQVDIRITVKAETDELAEKLIQPIEADLRTRLGKWVYGVNGDTLEEVVYAHLAQKGWKMVIVAAGLGEFIGKRLQLNVDTFLGCQALDYLPSKDELVDLTLAYRQSCITEVGLGIAIYPENESQEIFMILITPERLERYQRKYAGPPENAPLWAFHQSMDVIRYL
jgi:nicotinamide-nucleotide amidase